MKRMSVINAQCENRAELWTNVIQEEARYIDVITHIIDAEVRHAMETQHIDDALDLFSADYYVKARRQASHVYHNLYRGDRDQVQVIQSGDRSLSGRIGVVTQYFPPIGKRHGCFMVRLATKNAKNPTRFTGEKRLIEPRFIQPRWSSSYNYEALPVSSPVVILFLTSKKEYRHISFTVEKSVVDIIETSCPKDSPIVAAYVEPFVIATKDLSPKSPLLAVSPCLATPVSDSSRWDYFVKDGMFHFVSDKTGDHPRCQRMSPILVQCPCHQSLACKFKDLCGECTEAGNVRNPVQSPSPLPISDSGFDLDLLCRPDDILISVPFVTGTSIVPNAAFQLNELNFMKEQGRIVSEEDLMKKFSLYLHSVTNRDLFSLYPHNNINGVIIDVWTSW